MAWVVRSLWGASVARIRAAVLPCLPKSPHSPAGCFASHAAGDAAAVSSRAYTAAAMQAGRLHSGSAAVQFLRQRIKDAVNPDLPELQDTPEGQAAYADFERVRDLAGIDSSGDNSEEVAAVAAQDAFHALQKAAELGSLSAAVDYAQVLFAGQYGQAADQRESSRWNRAAARLGHPVAQRRLAYAYNHGLGLPIDHEAARLWYASAAGSGDPGAHYRAGVMQERGSGGVENPAGAVQHYVAAGEHEHVGALFRLGSLLMAGQHVPQDVPTALAAFEKAARLGHVRAAYNLGAMYGTGRNVTKDRDTAIKWYRVACDLGSHSAALHLYRMLAAEAAEQGNGHAEPHSGLAAESWAFLQLAAERGNPHARRKLHKSRGG